MPCRKTCLFLTVATTLLATAAAARQKTDAIVRVRVTGQDFSFFRPWQKKGPTSREGLGVVLEGNRVLITGRLAMNATFAELEKIDTGEKIPAYVTHVDYAVNLALLEPALPSFLSDMRPWRLRTTSEIGDKPQAIQFEGNGLPIVTEGEIKRIELATYPLDVLTLLSYRMEISIARNVSSYTLPVAYRNRLIGLVMTYSSDNREAVIVPAPVIKHFLEDYDDGHYNGFPRAGFGFASLQDPQLRRYLGVPAQGDGVFITTIIPGSGADKAGMQEGDVLLAINEFTIDKFGEYRDPDFGRQSIAHLTTTRSHVGDSAILHVVREGKPKYLTVKLESVPLSHYPIEPYVLDKPAEFIIVGGLVIQELSGQYLNEWGSNWATKAPRRLAHYARHQWDLFEPGEKVVILSQVLSSAANIGFSNLKFLRIDSINDMKIGKLCDVVEALKTPIDGFHKIAFDEFPNYVVLKADTLEAENAQIQARYHLPMLQRIE